MLVTMTKKEKAAVDYANTHKDWHTVVATKDAFLKGVNFAIANLQSLDHTVEVTFENGSHQLSASKLAANGE